MRAYAAMMVLNRSWITLSSENLGSTLCTPPPWHTITISPPWSNYWKWRGICFFSLIRVLWITTFCLSMKFNCFTDDSCVFSTFFSPWNHLGPKKQPAASCDRDRPMELSFWSCSCNDSGSGVLLKCLGCRTKTERGVTRTILHDLFGREKWGNNGEKRPSFERSGDVMS